ARCCKARPPWRRSPASPPAISVKGSEEESPRNTRNTRKKEATKGGRISCSLAFFSCVSCVSWFIDSGEAMAEFPYEAMANTGLKTTGTLIASSEREALAMLDGRGLYPMRIDLAKSSVKKGGKRVKSRTLATFYSQLADLLHSGVPLLRSLDIL